MKEKDTPFKHFMRNRYWFPSGMSLVLFFGNWYLDKFYWVTLCFPILGLIVIPLFNWLSFKGYLR